MTDTTSLGDRIKLYENQRNRDRLIPLLPVIVRLDGRAFHSWTKGLDRPFDEQFHDLMDLTAEMVMEETNAQFAYTQSDEISLLLYSDSAKSQIYFDGRVSKILSVTAAYCTATFNALCRSDVCAGKFQKKRPGLFDCRVFEVPTQDEAVNYFIWREQDAVRNSIQSVGQSKFSHKQLHGKNQNEIQEMLFQEHGINWSKFDSRKKRGAYFQEVTRMVPYSREEMERLPLKHEARTNPDLVVERNIITQIPGLTLLGEDFEEKIALVFGDIKKVS